MEINATENTEKKSISFIEQTIIDDLAEGKNGGRIQALKATGSIWKK